MFIISINYISPIKLISFDFRRTNSRISLELAEIKSQAQDDSSPTSVEDFEKKLMEMLSKIEDTQKNHQEINVRMMSQCEAEFMFRAKEIKDADDSYVAAESAFKSCQDSKNLTEANLTPMKSLAVKYQALITSTANQRKAEHERYSSLKKDMNEAIDFLGDFLEQIHQIQVGPTPSLTSLTQKTEDLLFSLSKVGRVSDSVPIFVALSSLELSDSKRSTEDVNADLQKAVLNLRTNMISDRLQADMEENVLNNNYVKLIKTFRKIVDTLNKNIDLSQSHLIVMNTCITSENKIMSESAMKSQRNTKLKNAAQVTCGDFAREFLEATKVRNQEIEVVKQIVLILKRRYGDIDHDVTKAIVSANEALNDYKDNTTFVRYVEYVIHHIDDNAHGRELSDEKN